MPDAATRFSVVAGQYDAVRPRPPADLIAVITQWAGVATPDVVDLGAGTGLSSLAWSGRARRVTAVEPSPGMRQLAERRIAGARAEPGTHFLMVAATAEDTGLPDGCADVVTASQAMHWFDPGRALPEIARLLRPGGVLAAYDCDWPPCIDPETGAAWEAMADRVDAMAARRGLPALHGGKDHAARIRAAGCSGTAPRSRCTGASRATRSGWSPSRSAPSPTLPTSSPTDRPRTSSASRRSGKWQRCGSRSRGPGGGPTGSASLLGSCHQATDSR